MNFTSGKSHRRRNPGYAENNKQCRERVRVCNVGLRMMYISSLVASCDFSKSVHLDIERSAETRTSYPRFPPEIAVQPISPLISDSLIKKNLHLLRNSEILRHT